MKLQGTKRCTKCGETKDIEQFYRNLKYINGRKNWCKQCHDDYMKQWSRENKRKIKQIAQRYYLKNKDRLCEKSRKWYEKNKERYKERKKNYNLRNAEKLKKYRKYYNAKYYVKNKELEKIRKYEWYEKNKDKILAKQKIRRRIKMTDFQRRYSHVKCDCGHYQKYHHDREGACIKCLCAQYFPNEKYLDRHEKKENYETSIFHIT